MMNLKTLNDEALVKVAGGNDGDQNYERKNHVVLYKVGDHVEVYRTDLHWFLTWGGTVAKVFVERDVPMYFIEFDDGCCDWHSADDIQRNFDL